MRVLFATQAETTHFLGMVPLAWALRAAGHEVQVASQPRLMDVVAGAGLTGVPVGRDHDFWRVMRARVGFDPLADRVPPFDREPELLTWEYVRDGHRGLVPWWWRSVNDPMTGDLVAYCRAWRPDLVVWEPTTFAGAIAAQAVGAAHARFLWGVDVIGRMRGHYLRLMAERPPGEREDVLADWLGAQAARYGGRFSEELALGERTVDHMPPSLRLTGVPGPEPVPLRFVPYNGRAVVPAWLREPARRPRVCVCLGTSSAEQTGKYVLPVDDVLAALAGLDAEVVAAVPGGLPPRSVPPNARVAGFVPLHALLPTCSVMIGHGGAGTSMTALAYGVPQLVVPRPTFDEPVLAARMAERGAALVLPEAEATPDALRDRVVRLLDDPGPRSAAAGLRGEILAMPHPREALANILASLVH
ncbi:glycosyltransferase, activator-dependent family [Sinosporangium album]|uniref:Glycosyltransferase, activator-dependent family n=1 Tax=Sinosporangium album TaxID=504805 RepID=A0A1G8GIU1_9ACTN|nr:activator-dependent family glycosyltransferase [Sinosporangium album]SDH94217.1 glycosyltransferase, activator-dependent family [Sinosporangium album]